MSTNTVNFGSLKSLLPPLLLFSLITNLTVLVSPVFMMQVLDRVVPSGNIATLILLLALALGALVLSAIIDYFRDVTLSRSASWTEREATPLAIQPFSEKSEEQLGHMQTVSGFLSGAQAVQALNIPWVPLFLLVLYIIHPYFLYMVLAIAVVTILLDKIVEFVTQDARQNALYFNGVGNQILEALTTHLRANALPAITQNLGKRFLSIHASRLSVEERADRVQRLKSAISGFLRMATQISALALGAYLVVGQELTAGGMIGASIITSKAVTSIEGAVSAWPNLIRAMGSLGALSGLAQNVAPHETEIPEFEGQLKAENLVFPRGGGAPPRLDRITLDLEAGECLAIVGDSGSGKTTLLHALAGIEACPIGAVFLDETEMRSVTEATRRKHIGYLPQQAQMLPGSLAENIASFDAEIDETRLIAAARLAGVHGLISALPNGYDTDIGKETHLLSAGQKQRVALARAVYSKPKYLFLDEPNALLDANGEKHLSAALQRLKEAGATIVMVLHRSGIMGIAEKVLVLDNGRLADFGPRAEVMERRSKDLRKVKVPARLEMLQDIADWLSDQFTRKDDASLRARAVLLASELFNAICLSPGRDPDREVVLHFQFGTGGDCELAFVEEGESALAARLPAIKAIVADEDADLFSLSPSDLSLAMVAQIADGFTVQQIDRKSAAVAHLSAGSQRASASAQRQEH